jgi:membrane protease subunit (stomatin/prohibitin family)
MLFYANICGNVADEYEFGAELEQQMKSEFLDKLQPAFARISEMGIRYSALPGRTTEISTAMKELLSPEWGEGRGLEVEKVAISSVTANEEDEKMIKEMQRNTAFMDPARAMAHTVGSNAAAMQAAASNTAGAMTGFMGMGMAQNSAGGTMQALAGMVQQQQAHEHAQQVVEQVNVKVGEAKAAAGWKCACGATVTGKFCPECGAKKPEAAAGWKCACGATATGKFCPECGSPKPAEAEGWTCACGTVNKGKFCPECGAKKPEGVPQYKCDKCGWEPEKGVNPPKFCPECGDPFDNGDIV